MAFDDDDSALTSEEELRLRILREREAAEAERATKDKELEEESVQLDKEIEEEIRGMMARSATPEYPLIVILEMTEEEKASIFAVPEFLDFVEHSTKIIQRALNDNYDYVRDYTIGTETGA